MAISKIVYDNRVLIDLTGDTVAAAALQRGTTAHDAAGNQITGTNDGVDTSDANAIAGEIAAGKTAYVNGVKIEGTMPDNGSVTASIDGLTAASVTIPAGYTSGGTVSLTSDIEDALAAI